MPCVARRGPPSQESCSLRARKNAHQSKNASARYCTYLVVPMHHTRTCTGAPGTEKCHAAGSPESARCSIHVPPCVLSPAPHGA
eukprot:51640-Pelagomonas_calceolata.AAC.3